MENNRLNIVFAASEAVPFAKTGGLADVCGTLPRELARLGHQTCLFLPAYKQVHKSGLPIEPTGIELSIPIGSKLVEGRLLKSHLPGNVEIPVYLVQQDDYYNRPQLYRDQGEDYIDNCERFVFFCRSVLQSLHAMGMQVDVLHAHDWQTGLLPAYLKTEYRGVPGFEQTASLFTVHNLAYQGQFWHWDMLLTGLDWKYFNWQQMEFYGRLNLMKTGIVFADAINTVSPRYAQEIQGPELGCGLEGVLQYRRNDLSGIINGVDYSEWNPEIDRHLQSPYSNYSLETLSTGKAACKAALQQEMGLPVRSDIPLIGIVGRLADQKGIDLVSGVLNSWARLGKAQWVILGTGEPLYHETLPKLAAANPEYIAVKLDFSESLSHRIEAGSDMFVMPSRFEPCGLNQLYSLRYGTVPVVRETGGLADTVVNLAPESLANQTATGFSFKEYSQLTLQETLARACETYQSQKDVWRQLVERGMRQDWSWTHSAREYASLYAKIVAHARQSVTV